MCGGDLHPEEGNTTCECEFCGTVQTIPIDNDEKKTNPVPSLGAVDAFLCSAPARFRGGRWTGRRGK